MLLLLLLLCGVALGITPSGELSIRQSTTVIYVAPGGFGDDLPDESDTIYRKLVRPLGDADGCSPEIPLLFPKNSQFYLLVQRGNCTFAEKAQAAESAGAKGIVIYNSLEGIYQGNDFAGSDDYECDNGVAYVPEEDIVYPIYGSEMDAAMPSECTSNTLCASQRCIFTNSTQEGTGDRQVCCAWDLYVTMGGPSGDDDASDVGIPAVFVRIEDEETLSTFSTLDALTMDVMLYKRPTWAVDVSSVLIWLLAVCTVGFGSVVAAEEDKQQLHAPVKGDQRERDYYTESDTEPVIDYNNTLFPRALLRSYSHDVGQGLGLGGGGGGGGAGGAIATGDSPIRTGSRDSDRDRDSDGDKPGGGLRLPVYRVRGRIVHGDGDAAQQGENNSGSMDITPLHAFGFVVVSSCFLLLLYFVDLYNFVSLLYLAAAAMAVCTVFAHPLLREAGARLHAARTGVTEAYVPIGDVSILDPAFLLAAAFGLGVSSAWYLYKDSSWAWLLQDYMGVAVCIMFLCTVRLPNLKVAALLLSLAFFYDIFFVFISPYVFSSSVMLQVATGGSTTTHSDENFCEKYPDDADCQDTALPMMMTIPTFSSYIDSSSILGLGDIVLPGLLLVWCARFDMRRHGTLHSEKASQGYFPMALFGYSAGLMLANFAVDYFDAGQPALLYIVPLTLGPVLYRSSRANTLADLWQRLPTMKTVALPLDREEQERLLSRSDVVPAVASWTDKSKARVITLTGQPIVPVDLNNASAAAAGAAGATGAGEGTDDPGDEAAAGSGSGKKKKKKNKGGSGTSASSPDEPPRPAVDGNDLGLL